MYSSNLVRVDYILKLKLSFRFEGFPRKLLKVFDRERDMFLYSVTESFAWGFGAFCLVATYFN